MNNSICNCCYTQAAIDILCLHEFSSLVRRTEITGDSNGLERDLIKKFNMAPKGKSGASNADLKQEDIVQAVVFADSFNTNFSPISHDKPRVLKSFIFVFDV
jgi:hypothetical protein